MKKVQAQRKFAQGVYMPTSTNINTVVDRRSDVGTGKDPKNVFHNNTSAKTLLDIVSFEGFHTHTPIVLIERLQEANLKVVDDSDSININDKLPQPIVKKTKTIKMSKLNTKPEFLKNSETMILRSRTRLAKKWIAHEVSCSTRKKAQRKKRNVEEYQSEDETPLKFLCMANTSKKVPPSRNKDTIKPLSNASTYKEDAPLSNKGKTKLLSKASTSNVKTGNKGKTKVRGKKSTLSEPPPSRNNEAMADISDMTYEWDESECNIEDDTESNTHDTESNTHDTECDMIDSDQYVETQCRIDNAENNIMENTINNVEYITDSTNNHTINNTVINNINIYDEKIDIVEHSFTENPEMPDVQVLKNSVANTSTGIIPSIGLTKNSANNFVQSDTNPSNNDDNMEDIMETESLNSEVENSGSELESIDSERDSVTINNAAESMDVSEEEDTEGSNYYIFNEITQWSGAARSDYRITEEDVNVEPNAVNERLTRKQKANNFCKAISLKSLCKMSIRCDDINEFVDTLKEKFKNRCRKCKTCKTIYRSCKIINLLKNHKDKFHQDQLCRLTCIRKNDKELVTIDLTDTSGIKKMLLDKECNGFSLMATIKQDLFVNSENTVAVTKIKNLTRDIITEMNQVIRSTSPISEDNDSDSSSDAPIMTRRCGQKRSIIANNAQGTLDLQPGPSGSPAAVIRSKLVEAPVFNPTNEEFQDPLAYFEKIMPVAAKYGLCKVVPPADFKPACNLNDNMQFNTIHQYIGRVYNRWGENTRELCAIRYCASLENVSFVTPPLVAGIELDLVKMFKAIQRDGGIKALDKKRWQKIADELHCTGVSNPDKLFDSFYLKYLLPYNTFSKRARQEFINDLEVLWRKKNQKMLERAMNPLHRQKRLLAEVDSSSDEELDDSSHSIMTSILKDVEDCVVRGRRTNLGNYKKAARNASKMYVSKGVSTAQIETSYWNIVQSGNDHVCVLSASIDTGSEGYGFTKHQYEPYGTHPWNLKMLSQNKGNVLRLLGSVIGLTVPTLHVGMVYSTSCWHRDPHGLPWVEYMHQGAQKIWYAISDAESYRFRKAVENLSPTSCQNKSIWLPSDITMIPPKLLLEHGVSLSKVTQNPGEFIIVFPKSYSCSINTGYTVSESVYFATNSWVNSIHQVFQELRDSCEPTMFSLEHLLFSAAKDSRSSPTMLQLVCTKLITMVNEEIENRNKAKLLNLVPRFCGPRNNTTWSALADDECQICRTTLYLSRVKGVFQKSLAVCITHALRILEDPKIIKRDVELYQFEIFFTNLELEDIITIAKKRLISVKPRQR